MKKKLLVFGFLFSLAINIAVLATVGHHWLGREKEKHHQEGKHSSMSYLYKELALSESQAKEMESVRDSLALKMDDVRKQLREKRVELVALLTESELDREKIKEKSMEVATLQVNIQKLIIDNLVQQKEILTPEQYKKLLSIISRRVCPEERHQGEGRLLMMEGGGCE